MMAVTTPRSSGLRGHLSGGQVTRYAPVTAAGGDRRAGWGADGGVGDGGGDRAGRSPGHGQVVGRGDRADQGPGSWVLGWAVAGWVGGRAAGRGGLPGWAGPSARRCRWSGARAGGGAELDHRGGVG